MITPEQTEAWLRIGRDNLWIKHAWDPPFNERSFHECQTTDELREKLRHGNWSLGQAFTYQDICFINQVDGGDEWLTIRHGFAFESITWEGIIARGGFETDLGHLLRATPEQCKTLNWTEA